MNHKTKLMLIHFTNIISVINLINGKQFLLVNGYTYSLDAKVKSGLKYRCTNNCKAHIFLKHKDGLSVKNIVHDHAHNPTKYIRSNDGLYIRI